MGDGVSYPCHPMAYPPLRPHPSSCRVAGDVEIVDFCLSPNLHEAWLACWQGELKNALSVAQPPLQHFRMSNALVEMPLQLGSLW